MVAGELPVADSSSAAESSFRELDDVFLQTQTRIWVGEMLQMRLDEQLNVSDLLSDGELLFEASKVVWKMLLKNRMELRHTRTYKYDPFASRKSSGKYKPYSNVDSFLKICKILGLAGIDIFTPSDVVEKRNTRKVCMCIRSFTKKARFKHLNVPDFDVVTYTIAMPTNMVGWIRRSLESQGSFSSSSGENSWMNSKSKTMQNNLSPASLRNYDSDSEESVGSESNPGFILYIQNNENVENTQLQPECESVGSSYLEQNNSASPTCKCENDPWGLGNGVSVVENPINAKKPFSSGDRNSNSSSFQMYRADSTLFDREDGYGFKYSSSSNSNATHGDFENGLQRHSDSDMEVSSTLSMHSLSDAVMNLDFYDQLVHINDFGTICSYNLQSPNTDLLISKTITSRDQNRIPVDMEVASNVFSISRMNKLSRSETMDKVRTEENMTRRELKIRSLEEDHC